jgi:hypothetical protein
MRAESGHFVRIRLDAIWRVGHLKAVIIDRAPPSSNRPGAAMNSYLVRVNQFLVFTERDPRPCGCPFPIERDIQLDDSANPNSRANSAPENLCVGIDPADRHHYRLFRSPPRRARAGFHQVVGMPVVVATWDDFLRTMNEFGEFVS